MSKCISYKYNIIKQRNVFVDTFYKFVPLKPRKRWKLWAKKYTKMMLTNNNVFFLERKNHNTVINIWKQKTNSHINHKTNSFFLLLSIQISKELYDICFVRESVYITHIFNLYFYDTRETKIWNKSFWQVFNHDWILLLLKLVFFSMIKKSFY